MGSWIKQFLTYGIGLAIGIVLIGVILQHGSSSAPEARRRHKPIRWRAEASSTP